MQLPEGSAVVMGIFQLTLPFTPLAPLSSRLHWVTGSFELQTFVMTSITEKRMFQAMALSLTIIFGFLSLINLLYRIITHPLTWFKHKDRSGELLRSACSYIPEIPSYRVSCVLFSCRTKGAHPALDTEDIVTNVLLVCYRCTLRIPYESTEWTRVFCM